MLYSQNILEKCCSSGSSPACFKDIIVTVFCVLFLLNLQIIFYTENSLTLFPTEHRIFSRNQTMYCWQGTAHKFSGRPYMEGEQPVH